MSGTDVEMENWKDDPLVKWAETAHTKAGRKPAIPAGPLARPTAAPEGAQKAWNFAGLDVKGWFRAHSFELTQDEWEKDRWFVRCPWEEEHSEGQERLTDTMVREGSTEKWPVPFLHCSHSHSGCRQARHGKHDLQALADEWGDAEQYGATRKSDGADADGQGRTPLWKRWCEAISQAGARLLWTDTAEAHLQLLSGEVIPIHSDEAALWFQQRASREAHYGSRKWIEAAGALRSWAEEHGEPVVVWTMAKVDFAGQIAYLGCEDGQTLYRVTPDHIERLRNGSDGVLIRSGCAPVLDEVNPTGALATWLCEKTWATPVGRLVLSIYAVMLSLGAQSFKARPLALGVGDTGTGKTTTFQMLGEVIFGEEIVAQPMKPDIRENESRIINERLTIFDNLDAPPAHIPVEDTLATACTMTKVAIRKMRTEGEAVQKTVSAHVVVTSFKPPQCLKRRDVVGRTLVVEFDRPDGCKVAEVTQRTPDRRKVWCDLLVLVQRVLRRWPETPDTSEHRSVEFVRCAHALLPEEDAAALERSLLTLQAAMAGLDDPILRALEERPPTKPMIAADLFEWWWSPIHGAHLEHLSDRPKNATALGVQLKNRAKQMGRWTISAEKDPVKNCTVWTFTLAPHEAPLTPARGDALLRSLVESEG